ncbi:hypothetical protein PUV54_03100 [Hyphococcus flavus]|uniref:Uncharacterized protein n=1 Tax=Hyphococcus flavus TaxID=1866326 RepID=A0AAE9ZFW5_9PROT|nr:hypothetical protein [Hyphococcus flavus]WDI32178.1 hypothetical protein PUV54_03100 [Hyphococcus flavus]
MLLRRITEHVKAQNWTAVALDFVIVVVGVFIGVQIGNWNASRQQHQIYEEAFDRTIVELQTNLESLESTRETVETSLPLVQQAIEDLRACRAGDEAHANVQAAFAPTGVLVSFALDTKALDQLINNDNFLPFQTPDTRKRLMALSTRLNTLQQKSMSMNERTAMTAKDVSHIVQPGPLVMEGPDQIVDALRQGVIGSPEMVRKSTLMAPLAQVCEDEALRNRFYAWEAEAYYHSVMAALAIERIRENLEAFGRPVKATGDVTEETK